MTRTMGDAIAANVAALQAAGTDMVAGYVTGSGDIQWTAADFALFPGKPQVTIDQGFTGSPVASAIVRDVEAGAWSAGNAVTSKPWTPARPTIYCSASVLPQVSAAGWQGDVWVADYVSTAPTSPYPVPAGMTCVAWQWTDTGGGGTYDLSVVFDPYWPEEAPVTTPATPQVVAQPGWDFCIKCGGLYFVTAAANVCPAGGQHARTPGGGGFSLLYAK